MHQETPISAKKSESCCLSPSDKPTTKEKSCIVPSIQDTSANKAHRFGTKITKAAWCGPERYYFRCIFNYGNLIDDFKLTYLCYTFKMLLPCANVCLAPNWFNEKQKQNPVLRNFSSVQPIDYHSPLIEQFPSFCAFPIYYFTKVIGNPFLFYR